MKPLQLIAALACLVAAWACSEPPPRDDAAPRESAAETGAAVPEQAPANEPAPTPAELWAACLEDPSRLKPCERHVRLAHDDPALPERLAEMAASHPGFWVPVYLAGYRQHWLLELREARRLFEEAARIARSSGDGFGLATASYASAVVLEMEGDLPGAEERVLDALAPARLSGDLTLQMRVVSWLAERRAAEGRYFDERPLRMELFSLVDRGENDRVYRRALYELAESSRCLGLHREAERQFREVLDLAREAGDPAFESTAGMALGVLAIDARDGRGLSLLEEASAAAARAERPGLESFAEMLAGMALIRAGRFEEARDRLRANLSHAGCTDDELRFRTHVYLADAERLCGDEGSALERYGQILAASAELELPEEERDALMGLAALHRERGEAEAAIETARRAVDLVESMRSSIPVFSDRTHFLQIRADTYRILAASLAERDPSDLAEPFAVIERAHARTLREALSREPSSPVSDEALSLSAVQRLLGPGDLLVEFLLGEQESSLIAVDAERATFHALLPRREIEGRIEAYRRALLRPLDSLDARLSPEADFRRFAGAGHELFRELLGPVAERVDAAERLIVVADRQLHLLPFEALLRRAPVAGRPLGFLGAARAVVYLPAAALLARPAAPESGRVLVVAADRARADLGLAPLRHAAAEARAVEEAYPAERIVLLEGEDARLAKLVEACAAPAGVLHLTAHAILDAEVGPRIALHASAGEEGWLDAGALERLPVAPRLVILSACDTARGELVGGEGILGLVRAFTLAGSRQVVASLWKVDDERTSRLMGSLHRELRGGSHPSQALVSARRELLEEGFEHPFYWAGLVLYGSD